MHQGIKQGKEKQQPKRNRRKKKFGTVESTPPTAAKPGEAQRYWTTPKDNANPSDTPPTVLAPGDKTGKEMQQQKSSRRRKKFGSVESIPPTATKPGEAQQCLDPIRDQAEVRVQTRAQKKREEEARKQDDLDTQRDEVKATCLEKVRTPEPEVWDNTQTVAETPTQPIIEPVDRAALIAAQKEDPQLKKLRDKVGEEDSPYKIKDGILMFQPPACTKDNLRIVVPTQWKTRILTAGHDQAGHYGLKKTSHLVQRSFQWPGMHQRHQSPHQQMYQVPPME